MKGIFMGHRTDRLAMANNCIESPHWLYLPPTDPLVLFNPRRTPPAGCLFACLRPEEGGWGGFFFREEKIREIMASTRIILTVEFFRGNDQKVEIELPKSWELDERVASFYLFRRFFQWSAHVVFGLLKSRAENVLRPAQSVDPSG